MALETHVIECPCCGESVDVTVESLEETQVLIEDCSVCCRPMQLTVMPGPDGLEIAVSRSE